MRDENAKLGWSGEILAKSARGRTGRRLCGVRILGVGRWLDYAGAAGCDQALEKSGAGTCGTVGRCLEREDQTHHGGPLRVT